MLYFAFFFSSFSSTTYFLFNHFIDHNAHKHTSEKLKTNWQQKLYTFLWISNGMQRHELILFPGVDLQHSKNMTFTINCYIFFCILSLHIFFLSYFVGIYSFYLSFCFFFCLSVNFFPRTIKKSFMFRFGMLYIRQQMLVSIQSKNRMKRKSMKMKYIFI